MTPASAAQYAVTGFPTPTTAGATGTFTVTALDAYGNLATGYAGTVHFTSSDAQAVLPANATLTGGTGTFSATLKTAGDAVDHRHGHGKFQSQRHRECDPGDPRRSQQPGRWRFPVGDHGGRRGELHRDRAGCLQQCRVRLHGHRPLHQQRCAGSPAGRLYLLDGGSRGPHVRGSAGDGGRPEPGGRRHGWWRGGRE